jgi:hypothetical protein
VAKDSVANFFATWKNATPLWHNVVWHFILPQPRLPQASQLFEGVFRASTKTY